MVTASLMGDDHAIRWLGYLIASSCVMFVLATFVEFSKPMPVMEMPKVLKVSLRTVAAPKPVLEKVKPVEHPPVPVVKKTPPVITQKKAVKKIVPILKKIVPETKPVPPKPVVKVQRKKVEKQTEPKPVLKKEVLKKAKPVLAKSQANDKGQNKTTVIENAKYRKQVPPVYPRRSYELGQQGIVLLHAEVMPNGKPKTLKVFKSSGHRRLDMAALAAVKKWEFETDMKGNAWVRVPVRFVIN